MKIIHSKDHNKFEVNVDGHAAFLQYIPRQNHLVVFDIEVPKFLEGQGIGVEIMKHTIEYARKHNLKIFPMHSMMTKFMSKDSKTQDLLLIK